MREKRRWFWILVLVLPAAAVVFLAGMAADRWVFQVSDPPSAVSSPPDFDLIRQAWNLIDEKFVDRTALKTQPLTYGAISGMVDALGDTGHSSFLSPDAVKDEQSFMRGQYVGVGLEIQNKNDQVMIVAPLDGSPAIKAGLRAGETIQKVDGTTVENLTLNEVVQRIIGPVGTSVTLTIYDPVARTIFDVTLQRAQIRVSNVSWAPLPGTALADLRVAAFSSGVARQVREALAEIQQQRMAGVVLDLRNDPGGELQEAIGVASQFLASGNVLMEKDVQGAVHADPVRPGGIAPSMPMIVLINRGTASGAEIVSGALQDAKRGTLIGETTFGTGTVLSAFPLSDGSQLLLATTEWLTPQGRTIWHNGVTPDVSLVMPPDGEILTPVSIKTMSADEIRGSKDNQLQKAMQMLQEQIQAPPTKAAMARTGSR